MNGSFHAELKAALIAAARRGELTSPQASALGRMLGIASFLVEAPNKGLFVAQPITVPAGANEEELRIFKYSPLWLEDTLELVTQRLVRTVLSDASLMRRIREKSE